MRELLPPSAITQNSRRRTVAERLLCERVREQLSKLPRFSPNICAVLSKSDKDPMRRSSSRNHCPRLSAGRLTSVSRAVSHRGHAANQDATRAKSRTVRKRFTLPRARDGHAKFHSRHRRICNFRNSPLGSTFDHRPRTATDGRAMKLFCSPQPNDESNAAPCFEPSRVVQSRLR